MRAAPNASYTKLAKAMHWSVAIFICINFPIGLYMNTFPHNSRSFDDVLFYHASIGSLIFMLAMPRLMWRMMHTPPALPSSVPRWQVMASHGLHWTLYVLMLAVPLTGYVHRLAGGHPVNFFGLGELPVFVSKDEPLRLLTDTLHKTLVFVLATLVVGHIAAALKHRFVDRDGVAERMWVS
ncbi:Cytochrome b561, putative [Ricinus communis]|uniref:Cytochrome b561, putative n=1 Tax=Ricinus communis TaxID=3988 RepID=B9TAU9_RICCO|nr:Cytochrome b561, putative [Ricinus communis]